jgi:hypothetical protein
MNRCRVYAVNTREYGDFSIGSKHPKPSGERPEFGVVIMKCSIEEERLKVYAFFRILYDADDAMIMSFVFHSPLEPAVLKRAYF